MPALRRFLLAANLGSLILFALGVVGAEFVLGIIFGSVQTWLALPAPMPVPQLPVPDPNPALEAEAEAEGRDAA